MLIFFPGEVIRLVPRKSGESIWQTNCNSSASLNESFFWEIKEKTAFKGSNLGRSTGKGFDFRTKEPEIWNTPSAKKAVGTAVPE